MGGIDAATGFPASMPSEKQGMFILGYYQQRQDFYTKKDKNTED
jgi:CRISPR-associated protein Csd1